MGLDEKKIQIPTYYIAGIFGKFDEHIKLLEKLFHIKVVLRDEDVKYLENLLISI